MGNAVLGGIVVLTGLNPYLVGAHFLLVHRAADGRGADVAARPGGRRARSAIWWPGRYGSCPGCWWPPPALLVTVGTLVTGAGPHAGDARDVHRIPVDWREITQLHVDFVYIVVGLTVALWFALRAVDAPTAARRRVASCSAC